MTMTETTAGGPRRKTGATGVFPQAVSGVMRRRKTITLVVLLALYYILPFLRWDRGPNAPDQAVLLDFTHAHFYLFGIELWAEDLVVGAGFMMLSAIGLFFVSTLYGRLWCGFSCPQTLWTDLFFMVERWIEGDRNQRMKMAATPGAPGKLVKRLVKHALWLIIAVLTGGVLIFYFNDAPSTLMAILDGEATGGVYFFTALFTLTTYLLAGFAREKVCLFMCPWPRFQAALLDKDSLVVAYQDWRGEPRGKRAIALRADLQGYAGGDAELSLDAIAKQAADAAEKTDPTQARGDCVACGLCVHVCPTGVDIRDGLQLGCIGCGLCIDACDGVMDKLDRPKGLIRFDSERTMEQRLGGEAPHRPALWSRPRVWMYTVLMLVITVGVVFGYTDKGVAHMAVLHDRQPLFVRMTDGSVRNAYTVRLTSKVNAPMAAQLVISGLPNALVEIADRPGTSLTLDSGDVMSLRVFLTTPRGEAPGGSAPVTFTLRDAGTGETILTEDTYFWGPN